MNRKWLGIAALVASATLLLSVSSCGHNQHLTSISVQPSSVPDFQTNYVFMTCDTPAPRCVCRRVPPPGGQDVSGSFLDSGHL